MRRTHQRAASGLGEKDQTPYRAPSRPIAQKGKLAADYEGQNGIPVTPEKFSSFRLRMEPNGRVVVPAELRALWQLSDRGELLARFRNGELILTTPRNGVLLAQAILAPYKRPGVSEVDEFLKARRAMWGEDDG